MPITITHTKTNAISDWTQPQLDSIVAGNAPPLPPVGTTLSQVVLPSDWNASHSLSGATANQILYGDASGALTSMAGSTVASSGTLLAIGAQANTDTPLILKQFSVSQSADLLRMTYSNGSKISFFNSAGWLIIGGNVSADAPVTIKIPGLRDFVSMTDFTTTFIVGLNTSGYGKLVVNSTECITIDTSYNVGINKTSSIGAQLHVVARSASTIGLIAQSAASPSVAIQQWKNNTTVVGSFLGAGNLLTITAQNTTDKLLILKGAASQTGNPLEVQNNLGVAALSISKDGFLLYSNNTYRLLHWNASLDSLFLGASTGNQTNSGANNYGFGIGCMPNITTASNNITMGFLAGFGLTTGSGNVILVNNQQFLTTGSDNFLAGANAGFNLISGSENSFLGKNSGINTTASFCTLFGSGTGFTNTSGRYLCAFGKNAGYANSSGDYNTYLGTESNTTDGTLTFMTAVGATAVVSASRTVALGATGADSSQVVINGTSATAQFDINVQASNRIGQIIKGVASQSANLQEWQNSSAAVKMSVDSVGGLNAPVSYGAITADADAATITFDCATSNKHSVTLGGNRTLALSNDKDGQSILLLLKQDGTGSRTVTWFSGILWAGGTVPTLTTTANKTDIFTILRTGSGAYLGFITGQNY